MKTKFNGILTLFLALIVQISFAQQRTISGIVSDGSGPLPGVNIVIKGSTIGTESDFDGKYSITAKSGDILIFSYLGYKITNQTVGSSIKTNRGPVIKFLAICNLCCIPPENAVGRSSIRSSLISTRSNQSTACSRISP